MKKKTDDFAATPALEGSGTTDSLFRKAETRTKRTTDRNWKEREEQRRRSAKAASTVTALSGDIEEFLTSRYDFRYNLLTDETEFRPAGQRSAAFTPVGKRELNTFCIEAHAEGIPCWDKDLNRYVYSTYIPAYHPFLLYMDELARLGRQGPADCACLPRLFSASLGAGIPYLDAGTCLAMDGRVRTACQQRGSRSRQPRAGTTEIQLLSRLDA